MTHFKEISHTSPKVRFLFICIILLLSYCNIRLLAWGLWGNNSIGKLSTNTKSDITVPGNYNLRNTEPVQSNEELKLLLNIRKLILFAVQELNNELEGTDCLKYWANPLDTISLEETWRNGSHANLNLTFLAQPGNSKFQVEILQQHSVLNVNDQELEIVSEFLSTSTSILPNNSCDVAQNLKAVCICSSGEFASDLEELTNELRQQNNVSDPELEYWPPNKSFMIEDYMSLTGDYDWFVTSPGKTKEDLEELHYSSEYCGPQIKMLVMVSSAPSHFIQRQAIRETYADPNYLEGKGVKVVFLMGVPTDNILNDKVVEEAEMTKDIIQANYDDSYYNMTISHLSMFKWALLNCVEGKEKGISLPQFILKADDDFLLSIQLALDIAQRNTDVELIGDLYCGDRASVVRDPSYKYYTPKYIYIPGSLPGYLIGTTYILRTDIIPQLLHAARNTPMIHWDDVYVTGILTRSLEIIPRHSPLIHFGGWPQDPSDICYWKKSVSRFVWNAEDMKDKWGNVIQASNCSLDDSELKVEDLNEDRYYRQCFFEL